MKGRLEHSLQIEQNIENMLNELPEYVTYYYYEFKIGRQPTACREYIRKISFFLNFINKNDKKNINPNLIKRNDITKFFNSIEYVLDANGNKKQSSLSYRKCYYSVLKSFFSFLLENDFIKENPFNKIKRPRGEDFIDRTYLDKEDLKQILLAVEDGAGSRWSVSRQKAWKSRDKAIIMLFIQTGMRETALSEINIEDIDFDNHLIKSVIEKGHKDKTFTMSDKLESALSRWLYDREIILDGMAEDALFISNNRTRISQKALSCIVKKYTKEAIGYSVSPHKLRAAFANLMLEETDNNVYVVQQLLGHARTETTKIYLRNNLNQYNDMAAEKVSALIF